MKRAILTGFLTVAVIAGAIIAVGAGSSSGKQYKIVFDNAFGLVKGADFKVGGVPVGSVKGLNVSKDARAVITVGVSKSQGFAGLRTDASCTVKPQSLIGEYFVDCQPGTKGKLLKSGATVPVKDTTSPIPPDLVLDIMREPEEQRFAIILNELGVGFAARGNDVNQTIRRALPALQTTNQVLHLLAQRRQTLADLARDSGVVLKVLGQRHKDVTDFVVQAKNASVASADRRQQIAETFHRFPGFLDQLTPTMNDLATASREMTPTLANLRIAAPSVTNLLNTLRPFAHALLPAVTTLGTASKAGRVASREAMSLVERLRNLGASSPETAKNLRIILDHLNNRKFAIEKDPDSPGGAGYTGLEAPLQYIFDQSQSANIFDQRGYALKINLTTGQCSNYTTAAQAKADPATYAECNQNLGPNEPGITTPDPGPTSSGRSANVTSGARRAKTRKHHKRRQKTNSATPAPGNAATPAPSASATPSPKPLLGLKPVQDLANKVTQSVPQATQKAKNNAQDLLDYLLKP